jgi:hypothetical protein
MSVFQAIGLGMNLIGGMQAAAAQEQQSKDQAEAMITDRIRGEAQSAQQQSARYVQYFDDVATNELTLLYNRDFDTSIAAFFEKQQEVSFDDLTIIARRGRQEARKATVGALLEVQRGKNRAMATRINTMSSFMSGLHDMTTTTA